MVNVNVENTNWKELSEQKTDLLNVIIQNHDPKLKDSLQGLVHFIDHIQDEASKELGEEVVFPNLEQGDED